MTIAKTGNKISFIAHFYSLLINACLEFQSLAVVWKNDCTFRILGSGLWM